MFGPLSFGTTNYDERIVRADGAWTSLQRHAAPPPEVTSYTRVGGATRAEALALDGALTRRTFAFERVPAGGCAAEGRVTVLYNHSAAVAWIHADSASPTRVFTDHDGDQVICVLEGGALLDTPCGTLRVNPAEHVFIPRHLPHRWRVDKLGLRAMALEVRGELALPPGARNTYGQLSVEGAFTQRDLNVPNWFPRPRAVSAPVPCALRRGGERWEGELSYDPLATVGWDGAVYPASLAWEVPLERGGRDGAVLWEHDALSLRTRITREDRPASSGHDDLVTLCLDGDGAASLVWEPLGTPPRPAGTLGGIVVQICARDPWRLHPNGALLAE